MSGTGRKADRHNQNDAGNRTNRNRDGLSEEMTAPAYSPLSEFPPPSYDEAVKNYREDRSEASSSSESNEEDHLCRATTTSQNDDTTATGEDKDGKDSDPREECKTEPSLLSDSESDGDFSKAHKMLDIAERESKENGAKNRGACQIDMMAGRIPPLATPDTDDDDEYEKEKKISQLMKMRRAIQQERANGRGGAEELEMMEVDRPHSSIVHDDASWRNNLTPLDGQDACEDEPPIGLELVDLNIEDNGQWNRRHSTSAQPEETSERDTERGEHAERREYNFTCQPLPIPYLANIITHTVRACQRGIDRWPDYSSTRKAVIILAVLLFIGIVLLVTLLPASFVYVEYHELAFTRNKVTGVMDYSRVYEGGCYLLAPQDELVRFKATAHFEEFNKYVTIDSGLNIKLQVMLQYFLVPDQLEILYKKYNMDYRSVFYRLIESTVKNTAIYYSLDQFRGERKAVAAGILKALKLTLEGDCCDSCCPNCRSSSSKCGLKDCKLQNCSEGYHVHLGHFQLGSIIIPEEVMGRYMRQLILQEELETEMFIQEKAVVVKNTERKIQKIHNEATEIRQAAVAESYLIQTVAEAKRDSLIDKTYQGALQKLFSRLNITNEKYKTGLMYIRALEDMKQPLIPFAYNYDKFTIVH